MTAIQGLSATRVLNQATIGTSRPLRISSDRLAIVTQCPLCCGEFNRSTQHHFTLMRRVGMACIARDMHGHGSCRSSTAKR